ncbi:hypothetical protein Micbo1qcDRAFT_223218 [Microdochium bolleyi]|uniref:Rhodopsin domain-containing protein n=1 Tax=Microdochium bolleyi TaxID=196109 RepID=A0A136J8T3_9PEZI|nr:hypothetical protein Micbo1qcDRAFT_223218 [Microdochium bolleyi]
MSVVDPSQSHVPVLKDKGLAIVAVSVAGGTLSAATVLLRTWVRVNSRAFGLDDGLMLGGLILYITGIGLACEGARAGLGTRDAELNDKMQMNSRMWQLIWLLLYTWCLGMIKSSICVTLLRIAEARKYFRVCVYVLLVMTVASWLITFAGLIVLCRPIQANWDTSLVAKGQASCFPAGVIVALGYISTTIAIFTDMACAALPAFLLWRMQMVWRNKILCGLLLSFGSLACISTMIRAPSIESYRNPTENLPYHVGNIVLWSNVESAIGLIAGSIPSLRILFVRMRMNSDSDNYLGAGGRSEPKNNNNNNNNNNSDIVTIGSAPNFRGSRSRGRGYRSPTETGLSTTTIFAQGEGDWRRLGDGGSEDKESQKGLAGGIRADYSYQVELTELAPEERLQSANEARQHVE